MKIALIKQKYHRHGGAEKNMVILAEGLLKKGHEVTVFCRKWEGNTEDGIDFTRVTVPGQPMFLRLLFFNYSVLRMIKKKTFDIAHSFEMLTRQDVYRASGGCARRWNRKLEEMNPGFLGKLKVYSRLYRLVEQFIEKRTFTAGRYKKIIAISNKVKDEIMEFYNVPANDIEVVYNGVNLEEFSPENRNEFRVEAREKYGIVKDDFLVLFVGSGFERKGLEALIRSIALLEGKNQAKLLVVGGGRRAKYEKLSENLSITDRVIFAGHINDMRGMYAAADTFVLPSVYEPFGSSCLEALAAGLPVIVSSDCGASEIIDNNVNGLIINDCRNAAEIADKIEKVLNKYVSSKLAEGARTLAENYSRDKYISKTISVYNMARPQTVTKKS